MQILLDGRSILVRGLFLLFSSLYFGLINYKVNNVCLYLLCNLWFSRRFWILAKKTITCTYYLHHICRVEPGKPSSISKICIAFGNVIEWDIPNTTCLGRVTVKIWNQKQLPCAGHYNPWFVYYLPHFLLRFI